jgi:hypothetical protein
MEIQLKCVPLLSNYRHERLTIIALIEHQTQLLKDLDPS